MVSKYFHFVEDEGLVPGGIECVPNSHSLLALMQEGHNGIGI